MASCWPWPRRAVAWRGDVAAGKELRRLAVENSRFTALAFAPDGKTLAAGSSENTLRCWDVASGKELEPPSGHRRPVLAALPVPDGKTLISAGRDSTIRFWDVASGKQTRQLAGKITPRELASYLDPDTAKKVRQFEKTPWVLALALTAKASGWRAAVPMARCTSDAATGRELHRLRGHDREVRAVDFTPDSRTLVSGGEDGTLRLWDVRSGKERRRLMTKQGQVIGVSVSPVGKVLASMGWDTTHHQMVNSVRLWDLGGGPWGD